MTPFLLSLVLAAPPDISADNPSPFLNTLPRPTVVLPTPVVPRVKESDPTQPINLTADLSYYFSYDVPVMVLSSPPGVLIASNEAGPVRVKARFADDPTEVRTRNYPGKTVWEIKPNPKSLGTAELIVFPVGTTDESKIQRVMVRTGVAPQPPPGPTPFPPGPNPPGPTPQPDGVNPFGNVAGLHVLIVWNRTALRPQEQQAIITGVAVRDYLNLKCAVDSSPEPGSDGKAYRIWPTNADVSAAPKVWADAYRTVPVGQERILIGNGPSGYSGPLPKNGDEALTLLKRYGGN